MGLYRSFIFSCYRAYFHAHPAELGSNGPCQVRFIYFRLEIPSTRRAGSAEELITIGAYGQIELKLLFCIVIFHFSIPRIVTLYSDLDVACYSTTGSVRSIFSFVKEMFLRNWSLLTPALPPASAFSSPSPA